MRDGALYLDAEGKKNLASSESGDLVTNEEYDNFDLKLDWKISKNGNSGIIFYMQEDPAKYPYSYLRAWKCSCLIMLHLRMGHADGKIYKHKAGDLYDLIASKKKQ